MPSYPFGLLLELYVCMVSCVSVCLCEDFFFFQDNLFKPAEEWLQAVFVVELEALPPQRACCVPQQSLNKKQAHTQDSTSLKHI